MKAENGDWVMKCISQAFVNFENFTDTRLSKFQDTVIPPHTNPSFPEIWSPTDGFIFTAGLKWTIFGEIEEE